MRRATGQPLVAPVVALVRAAASFVFPDCCLSCSAPVPAGERHLCPACRAALRPGRFTTRAPAGSPIDRVLYVLPFRGPARDLVRALKYDHRLSVAGELGRLVLPEAARLTECGVEALVPVPLHRTRRRERGFNQSELLASAVGEPLGLPVALALRRVRATRTQTDLPRGRRLRNVEGAFEATRSLAGMSVVVVDDVVTTGATIAAACSAALEAGASAVAAMAVAGPDDALSERNGRARTASE